MPQTATGNHRDAESAHRRNRRDYQEVLSPTPPVECLSVDGLFCVGKIKRFARTEHRSVKAFCSSEIQTVEITSHNQRRRLIISPTAVANAADKSVYLRNGKFYAVAFFADYFLRSHSDNFNKLSPIRLNFFTKTLKKHFLFSPGCAIINLL